MSSADIYLTRGTEFAREAVSEDKKVRVKKSVPTQEQKSDKRRRVFFVFESRLIPIITPGKLRESRESIHKGM